MDENMNIEPEKRKFPLKLIILLSAAAAFIIIILVYMHLSEKYRTVFFDHTTINGIDVSGMTAQEADAAVSAKGEEYHIDVFFRDGTAATITGEQMDYGYHAYDEIALILNDQIPMQWIFENGNTHTHEVTLIPDYNEEMLGAAIAALPQLQPENMTAPTDAYVIVQDKRLVVIPETEGNLFDADLCAAAIADAVSRFEPALDVAKMDIYAGPEILSAQAAEANHVEELNHLLSAAITFELPQEPVLLDDSILITWISTDEQGHFYKDDELWNARIRDYVQAIADIVLNSPNVREFDTTGLGTIVIEGGTYHNQVDVDAEAADVAQLLADGAVASRTPRMKTASGTDDNHGLGSTYVEIDLSRQILWAYDHGELFMKTPIVSGRMTEDRYTPGGVYFVYYKQRDRVLHGDAVGMASDGTPIYQYASPVSYWMPFNGGIGMHDADWRGAFGGSIYITDGSHGCINMPVDEAPKMYDWVNSDIPIVVYYSEPYTLAPATGEREVISSADNSGEEEYVEPSVSDYTEDTEYWEDPSVYEESGGGEQTEVPAEESGNAE